MNSITPAHASAGANAPLRSETEACRLPQILDLTAAQKLREDIETLLTGGGVVLDAEHVERMSTPCIQVLLAAARSAETSSVRFRVVNASDAFRSAVHDLGLQSQFSTWMV